jgi:formylglycine-generating enzyme
MRNVFTLLLFLCIVCTTQAQSKSWNFTRSRKIPIQLDLIESWFCYIPAQTYPTENKLVSVKSFYIMRWETPNMFYQLFLEDLKASGKNDEYKTAYPDTNIWSAGLEPYVHAYFQNPKLNHYPVMGVTKTQIRLFCDWLNKKINTLKLKNWKDKKIQFRLPTEIEWMVAASGGDTNAVYAWKGPYMRTMEKGFECDFMANFRRVGDGDVFRDDGGNLVIKPNKNPKYRSHFVWDKQASITAPVNNYWPNAYGIFCMTGNVREMVQEDGFTKGGGWIDPGGECQIQFRNTYQKEGFPCEGFRLVVEVE